MEKFLVIYSHPADGPQYSLIESELPDSKDPADWDLEGNVEILAVIGVGTLEDSEEKASIEKLDLWLQGEQVLPA